MDTENESKCHICYGFGMDGGCPECGRHPIIDDDEIFSLTDEDELDDDVHSTDTSNDENYLEEVKF